MDQSNDMSYFSNGSDDASAPPEEAQGVSKEFSVPVVCHEPMDVKDVAEVDEESQSMDAFEYTKREEFTSEIFKMEVRGLPKYFPPGQLKKLLSEQMQLDVKKIKPSGSGKEVCYITFADKVSVEKAIVMLNGYKWKGKSLTTRAATAAPDPLVRHIVKKASDETYKSTSEEVDKLPIEERVAMNVTPYASMPYEEQLIKKQEAAHKVLQKVGREIAKVNPELEKFVRWHKLRRKGSVCEMDPIIPSPVVDGYRNKCEFTIGINSDSGETCVGFRVATYKKGNVSVGPVDQLKHINDTMKTVVKSFERFVCNSGQMPFDPVTHDGVWRQLMIRTTNGGDCLLAVSIHPQKLNASAVSSLKEQLVQYCEQEDCVTSLYCVSYGQRESGVEDDYEHLYGTTHITETLLGKKFRISPQAFFQVNTAAAEKLYEAVGELAEVDGTNVLLDVCCGTGTIGITLAEGAFKMYGLEIVEAAVEDAQYNAALNELDNTAYLVGNCEHTLPSIFSSVKGLEIKAVVDPPRAGLPSSVISTLRKHDEVTSLVYMACDPNKAHQNFQSLARPISKQIRGQFFVPVRAVAVDLFPHTDKFELVIVWERYDESKWRRMMEGNPRPRDEAYFKRLPPLPSRDAYIKDWVEKKATDPSAEKQSNGSCKRKMDEQQQSDVQDSGATATKTSKVEGEACVVVKATTVPAVAKTTDPELKALDPELTEVAEEIQATEETKVA